jgi:phosphate transport system protein
MSIKTRQILDKELQHLQDEMLALSSMVENAITESVDVLKRRDMDGSRCLIAQDRLINEKRFAIEDEALVLMATQQPIATDLRVIAAMLDIAHELERIGDYAKGIAKINLLIGEAPLIKPLIDVPAMAAKARADHPHSGGSQYHRRGKLPIVGGTQPGAVC